MKPQPNPKFVAFTIFQTQSCRAQSQNGYGQRLLMFVDPISIARADQPSWSPRLCALNHLPLERSFLLRPARCQIKLIRF
jgi:hypothetical protein